MPSTQTYQTQEGIAQVKLGNTFLGLKLLNSAANDDQSPEAKAWFGYCLAVEKKQYVKGLLLCLEAKQSQPENSDVCLAAARLYLIAGNRASAVKSLQQGLALRPNPEISRLLNAIGVRKKTVFPFLPRAGLVNRASGLLFCKLGWR
ncbi:tetratricopeptide repeat protein [Pelobacter seleniigenes]|uniref:tetratricopeptide repeat protein n=1 Tax=Pelobacter seleniigenes TaxID=407188 RepID=UPI000689DD35|nr:tetratricopeptide repeat protein [Pelobacter seleniigenes]